MQKLVLMDPVIRRWFSWFHFFGSINLEEGRLDTILAQIFHDNSSAIQSTAHFPTWLHNLHKTVPFPFCGGFLQLLAPSSRCDDLWGSGWAECLAAFSIWGPGLGKEVLVLPALKPSLKVGLLQAVNLNFTLSSPWRTEMVSLLCWVLGWCLHALSMPLSVLPALRNTIKRLFWRLTAKQALLAPHLRWDFLNAELFFT